MPAINLAHVDLARGEQCPEQHGSGVRGRQHGLRLDPSRELLVQSFDRIVVRALRHWIGGRRVSQTNPNSTQRDNYGTLGNTNPPTGAVGTRGARY